jgi:uncharacterized RDD family membrane protein YckC
MIGDSVREELASKIVPIPKAEKISKDLGLNPSRVKKEPNEEAKKAFARYEPSDLKSKIKNEVDLRKPKTAEVNAKTTDPTLVEFQNKAAAVPEWKLRLQNAVRRRLEQQNVGLQSQSLSLKVSESNKEVSSKEIRAEAKKNEVLEKALRRIEESRLKFSHLSEPSSNHISKGNVSSTKADAFKTKIQSFKTEEILKNAEEKPSRKLEVKTFPIVESKEESRKFETTKLTPLPEFLAQEAKFSAETNEGDRNRLVREGTFDEVAKSESESLENWVEDYAPISHRFGAGLFDLIVGVFLSFILLLPFVILGKTFFSVEALFAFLTTMAIVMFVYLTTCITFFGQTLGMKIFSLEIIDVEENDYPTLHQAAVNTIVYLLSLLTLGLGFLPALFNRERRTMHDLVAGTIVVKEMN